MMTLQSPAVSMPKTAPLVLRARVKERKKVVVVVLVVVVVEVALVVVVVVVVVGVNVGPAAATMQTKLPNAARVSSIIGAYFRLMLAHVSPSGATKTEKWKKQKTL